MKIEDVSPVVGERVTTDENEFNEYTRYAAECWYVQIGEIDKPVYECRELERLYQEYKRKNS